jgi:hypothetical protein
VKSGNRKKGSQLGMPLGTAYAKLRKSILFKLVQQTGQDLCFQCGEKIKSIDDLSIEHKKPWLDNDPALFWNLENIAFSHLNCNIGAARKPLKIEWPKGQAWCARCKQMKQLQEFPPCKTKRRGTHCTICLAEEKAGWRDKTGKH